MFFAIFVIAAAVWTPDIPRTWSTADVSDFELPLAGARRGKERISEIDYYKLPLRTVFRTYPVYHPSREPAAYQQWLKKQKPAVAFETKGLRTRQDWIRAGEAIFHYPASFGPVFFGAEQLRDPEFYRQTGMPVASDGTVPFASWVVREEGKVELGSMGCNTCHVRVLDGGIVVAGAQGNNPGDRQGAWMLRRAVPFLGAEKILQRMRNFARQFEMPWIKDDPNRVAAGLDLDAMIAAGEAIPPGVTARAGTSMIVPPQIPDLIGVAHVRFLDHTGAARNRSIGDLMRYATLVVDLAGGKPSARFSDEHLYALALFLHSMRPPENPNRMTAAAGTGRQVFEREKCGRCHAGEFYTNNKLMKVERIGTDARSAMQTRKGTGYYKTPSLRGLWYRGPLEHNGSVATLEEWFDAARLRTDHVPGGFRGHDGARRGVPGHEFGLKLGGQEKAALIAFLKTL